MLAKKNMKAVSQAFGSLKAARTSFAFSLDVDDEGPASRFEADVARPWLWLYCCAFSCRRRRRASSCSRGVRNAAVSGESGITFHAMVATRIDGKPSRRNSSLHDAIGTACPTHRMSQARKPAKADASGAARSIHVRLLVLMVCASHRVKGGVMRGQTDSAFK